MRGACYDWGLTPLEHLWLRARRAKLLAHARGKTLEVGVGTGLNLAHYPPEASVTGIEPDASMRTRALARLSAGTRVEAGEAENLAFAEGEFDTVVATLVLCSVQDPGAALREIHRVLKPGGCLLLMEHVRPRRAAWGRVFDLAAPAWSFIFQGCRLDRDPGPALSALGFRVQESEEFWLGVGRLWVFKKPG